MASCCYGNVLHIVCALFHIKVFNVHDYNHLYFYAISGCE